MKGKENKKQLKKHRNEGITLIALVITILILIILATVAISVVFGEGGLIDRAQQAKDLYEQAQTQEQQELLNTEAHLNELLAGTGESTPEPENSQKAIEITDLYWDISTLKEEERNIDGYYLIKNNCTITNNSLDEINITSRGTKVLEIGDNVTCQIDAGNFTGKIVMGSNSNIIINNGTFNGEIEFKNGSVAHVNGGTFNQKIILLENSTVDFNGEIYLSDIISNGEINIYDADCQGNINLESNSDTEINGGSFSGEFKVDNDAHLVIRGGVFNHSVENYLEEGYILIPTEQIGYNYEVVEG